MNSSKKRKIGRLASRATSSKDKVKNGLSGSVVRSPSLPPRPVKTFSTDADPPKAYDMFTASTPSPSSKSRKMTSSPSSPSLRGSTGSPHLPLPPAAAVSEELGEGVGGYGSHEHHRWDFLHKTRKDKLGRSPDHPDFNPRTIAFPPSFLKEQTPAMKQWCEVKADNFDTVLFFKVPPVTLPHPPLTLPFLDSRWANSTSCSTWTQTSVWRRLN
jgi:hypothetical protein